MLICVFFSDQRSSRNSKDYPNACFNLKDSFIEVSLAYILRQRKCYRLGQENALIFVKYSWQRKQNNIQRNIRAIPWLRYL